MRPITNQESYQAALAHVADEAEKLIPAAIGQKLPINTVTIFAQSNKEYEFIENYLLQVGAKSRLSHGATTYVKPNNQTMINGHIVILLGVRQADKSRPERGYADFPVSNYEEFKQKYGNNPGVQEIRSGGGMYLLELKRPGFDVRGYIVER